MFDADQMSGFFDDLRSSGYQVGIAEQTRVAELIVTLKAQGNFPRSSKEMARFLGPLLCKSVEQQLHFPAKFEVHFGRWYDVGPTTKKQTEASADPGIIEVIDTAIKSVAQAAAVKDVLRSHEVSAILKRALIVTVAVFALAVLSSRLVNFEQTNPEDVEAPSTQSAQTEPTTEAAQNSTEQRPSRIERLRELWSKRISDFWSDVKAMTGPAAVYRYASGFGLWGLLALSFPFALAMLWVVAPGARTSAFLRRRRAKGRPAMVSLLVDEPRFNPFDVPKLSPEYQTLRRPFAVTSDEIDVERSLLETVRLGGLFSPVKATRLIAPEYLVLIDRKSFNDHVGRYAEALLAALQKNQIYTDVYWYNGDLRRLFRSYDDVGLTFEEVAGRCAAHRLILITNGVGLFNRRTGEIANWAEAIKRFSMRLILTPAPKDLWGYRESALSSVLSLPVLRLSPETVPDLTEVLTSDALYVSRQTARSIGPSRNALTLLSEILADRPLQWSESTRPSETAVEELIDSLKEALGPNGFSWLAACAVYPELQWNLTLHLRSALTGPIGQITPDASHTKNLSILSILPWFRTGSMPGWLRSELIEAIPAQRYHKLRDILAALLQVTFARSDHATELIFANQPSTLRRREAYRTIEEHGDDPLLIDFLGRKQDRKTFFKLPERIVGHLRIFGGSGLLRNLLSQAPFEEAAMNAAALQETLDEAAVVKFEVEEGWISEFGPDFKRISRFLRIDSSPVYFEDRFLMYLSARGRTANIVDVGAAELLTKRRKSRTRFALLYVLLAALVFIGFRQQEFGNAIEIVGSAMVFLVPFSLFHLLGVRRYEKCLENYPQAEQKGDMPKFSAVEFER